VVSVLDSGAAGLGFKSQPRRCRVTVLRKLLHTHRASVHQTAKLVAALLWVAEVTTGLAESNGSLPPGLWLTSTAGWLPRTGIGTGTLRSAIEYGLPFYHHEFITKTAISISLISSHNSFRVLFDNIACVYFTRKIKRLETNVADGTQVTLKLSAEMLYRRSTLREISPSIGHVTLQARASGITTWSWWH